MTYLYPTNTSQTVAQSNQAMQNLISGITRIPGNLIYHRWQLYRNGFVPPSHPNNTVNWASFGIREIKAPFNSTIQNEDTLTQNCVVTFNIEFYGQLALENAEIFRDGVILLNNQDYENNINDSFAYESVDSIQFSPEKMNEQWLWVASMDMRFLRVITRTYGDIGDFNASEVTMVNPGLPNLVFIVEAP